MADVVKEVRNTKGAVVAVAYGEITLDRSPALHKALLEVCAGAPKHLIVDLTEVSHIDSAGVGTLVDVFRRLTAAKARLSLVGLSPRVRSVFEITRLDRFFTICDTEDEAHQA